MTIAELLAETDETEAKLAARLGVRQPTVNRLRRRTMKASLVLALQVEEREPRIRAEDLPLSRGTRRALASLRARNGVEPREPAA